MTRHRPASREGFTLIELLIVVTILSTLGGIALPTLRSAVYRADAVRVVSDMVTVRLAVTEMLTTTGVAPADSDWGAVPAELQDYLPDGFEFSYKDVEYAWALLDASSLQSADAHWVYQVHAYNMTPPRAALPQGKGQTKGKGASTSGGAGSTEPDQGTGAGSGGDETGDPTSGDLVTGSTVGVLWVRYDAGSALGQALQRHAGSSAFWTPTQMAFVVLE